MWTTRRRVPDHGPGLAGGHVDRDVLQLLNDIASQVEHILATPVRLPGYDRALAALYSQALSAWWR